MNFRSTIIASGIFVLWASALALGMHAAMLYDSTPGRAAAVPPVPIAPSTKSEFTCILVAHPLCPCTTASLEALSQVAEQYKGRLAVRVVFAGELDGHPSRSLKIAESIPGAQIEWISPDQASKLYGAFTSGQAFVYKRTGELVFSGGITPGRGVDKPRFALELFDSIFRGAPVRDAYPVFGCQIARNEQ